MPEPAEDPGAALDPLVERLERAAEQLRSGDLSADAAASTAATFAYAGTGTPPRGST